MKIEDGRRRVVIEDVYPEIDGGRFAVKRTTGEAVRVEADIYCDGHEVLACQLLYRKDKEPDWSETDMTALMNDRWRGSFLVEETGLYVYTLRAWVDRFKTWRRDLTKKVEAGQEVHVDLLSGSKIVEDASLRTEGGDAVRLREWSSRLSSDADIESRVKLALDQELALLIDKYPDYSLAVFYDKELPVMVDRERARFSAWYEMFPRSCTDAAERHGTFADCEAQLPYVSEMGFDVLYLPPIHPIGKTKRKGRNNTPEAGTGDPGSPWAIGGVDGGHKAVHPDLGTLEGYKRLLKKAGERGIDIAMDLAFQCSPDHPYPQNHPEWFRHRPDGSIQYAENPPKKYEDIYPLDFETEKWRELWEELKSVVFFWIEQGIRIFRVDNPHTKPFPFWEWLISETKAEYPDVLFLAEAFTRPKVMYRLAKLGFTQSYTYFAWRNIQWEIREYFTELTQTEVREYFRPNLWPNTPDILTEYLQIGGRPAFMVRIALAATLGANYGIYGPALELCVNQALKPGSEEYLNSEKYEIHSWDIRRPDSLKEFIARLNRIRRENPALQHDVNLRFHKQDNDQLICYSKHTDDFSNIILIVANLDPHHAHSGWIEVPLEDLGLQSKDPYQVHDLLSDARYLWNGPRNYVELDPKISPAHIFRIRRRIRTERDFDYYL